MIALAYINPWILFGFAGVAIPIIIHLLFKRRKRRILFSTLRFLKIATRENARRMKIKQWLLLLLRLCIIALIVLAFARPFFRNPAAGEAADGSREVILAIDVSCSMRANNGMGATRIEYAKERALSIIEGLGDADRAGLIVFDSVPRTVSELTEDRGALRGAVAGIQAGYGSTDYASAVKAAQDEFDWESDSPKELVLISDLQRTGLSDNIDFDLNPSISLKVISISDPVGNLGISRLETGGAFHQPGEKYPLLAVLQDYGNRGFEGVRVTATGNGTGDLEARADVKQGAARTVPFEQMFPSPGYYGLEFHAETDDGFADDNTRYLALDVREPVRILCVNGTPSSVPYFRETIYVEAALNPYRLGKLDGDTVFSSTVVSPEELGGLDFSPYSAVVMANVRDVDAVAAARLEDYVRRGGGLMWWLGEEVLVPHYNQYLYAKGEGILPAAIAGEEGDPADIETFWTISSLDKNHFVSGPFNDPAKGDISLARFYKRYDVGSLDQSGSNVVALFHDGRPALIEKALGDGRILLFTSTADTAWNDFARRKTYPPFIHRCLLYVTGNTDTSSASESFVIGDRVLLGEEQMTVQAPTGEEAEITEGGFAATDMPGVYYVRDVDGTAQGAFAINLDPRESELEQLSPDELQTVIAGGASKASGTGEGTYSTLPRREIWSYLLIALLFLLLGEVWLANHTPA